MGSVIVRAETTREEMNLCGEFKESFHTPAQLIVSGSFASKSSSLKGVGLKLSHPAPPSPPLPHVNAFPPALV